MNFPIYLPSPYHWKQIELFEQRLKEKQKQIDNIDQYLASRDAQMYDPRVLQIILSLYVYNSVRKIDIDCISNNKVISNLIKIEIMIFYKIDNNNFSDIGISF